MANAPKGHRGPDMAAKRPKTAAKTPAQGSGERRVAVSPLNGAEIPLGAHPGNTGGKPGRSGRKPNELREAFRHLLDDGGIDFVRGVIRGRVPVAGVCGHCGQESGTPQMADDPPTVDNRLRAVDAAAKYGLGERSEFSEDVVAENVDRMLSVAETIMSEEEFKTFARQTDAIWNADKRG